MTRKFIIVLCNLKIIIIRNYFLIQLAPIIREKSTLKYTRFLTNYHSITNFFFLKKTSKQNLVFIEYKSQPVYSTDLWFKGRATDRWQVRRHSTLQHLLKQKNKIHRADK